jgi:hypothetical protein
MSVYARFVARPLGLSSEVALTHAEKSARLELQDGNERALSDLLHARCPSLSSRFTPSFLLANAHIATMYVARTEPHPVQT